MPEEAGGASTFGVCFLACMILLMWWAPRRMAILPLFVTTCYMPLGQMFVVADLNLQFFRILLLASWVRVLARGEHRALRFGAIDRCFAVWLVVTLVLGSLTDRSQFAERFINRSGEVFNAGAAYFLVRCWVRNLPEVVAVVRALALIIVPLAGAMLMEKITNRNVFYVLGGVPEFTFEREGRLRCQGAFRHPILAGTYGATLFPLFVGLWWAQPKSRRIAVIGIVCAVFVTLAASSSGAVLALVAACLGFAAWRLRKSMRAVRWGILGLVIALSFAMNAPVWYVFSRASEVVGGTGWYRSYLIEQAVNHFDEWWLTGTRYTAHWAPGGETPVGNPDNTDIINHYVAEGLDGGILKLTLFVGVIVLCFSAIGRITSVRKGPPTITQRWVWSMGVCLMAHCVSFLSVVYFDQIIVMWFWILAAVAVLQARRLPIPRLARDSGGSPGPDVPVVRVTNC